MNRRLFIKAIGVALVVAYSRAVPLAPTQEKPTFDDWINGDVSGGVLVPDEFVPDLIRLVNQYGKMAAQQAHAHALALA